MGMPRFLQHAASNYWDILHIDLKTAFLQGETYDLERRVIRQLPSDIGLPPCLVGLCTRSVYGLADAPRRWWNRLDKFLISLGIQPTRADRCTYVCYDGAFKDDDVSAGAKTPKQVSYYVDSQSGEMTRDESFEIANEVRQSFAVEERLFSLCHAEGKSLRYIQKKSENKIHLTLHVNNKDTSRRRVKIVHGPLLLMKNCWSS